MRERQGGCKVGYAIIFNSVKSGADRSERSPAAASLR
ncbi:hypothetical protein [Pantoea piersonii]